MNVKEKNLFFFKRTGQTIIKYAHISNRQIFTGGSYIQPQIILITWLINYRLHWAVPSQTSCRVALDSSQYNSLQINQPNEMCFLSSDWLTCRVLSSRMREMLIFFLPILDAEDQLEI
jgi:hypothetical protein